MRREGASTTVERFRTSGILLAWDPATRILTMAFDKRVEADPPDADALEAQVREWGGVKGDFSVLVDCSTATDVGMRFRARLAHLVAGRFGATRFACHHLPKGKASTLELFARLTGIPMRAFDSEAAARAWLTMPAACQVRPAMPGDAADLTAILREAAQERWSIVTQPEEVPTIEAEETRIAGRSLQGGAVLVAERTDRVVGFCDVVRPRRRAAAHVADVGLTVAAAHRGKGVGHALLLEAERWAQRAGVERLTMGVLAHNERARRLYASLGYVEEGVRVGQYRLQGRPVDEVLMAKTLQP